jgi:CubicO group peptidase (beta-lactamase class C family)
MSKHGLRALLLVLSVSLGCFLRPTLAWAQEATPTQKAAVQRLLRRKHVNGLALINGPGDYPEVIGNRVTKKPRQVVRPNRLIPIASFQKLMTGVAVNQLALSGKLALSTPLSAFYPQVANGSQITIGRLMMHTSGLRNVPGKLAAPLKDEGTQRRYTLKHYRSTGKLRWCYSDVDFSFLAAIIHQTTEQSYQDYLADKVLGPLGVRVTFADQLKNGHRVTQTMGRKQGWSTLQKRMSTELGAGDILCTPVAYWHFLYRGVLDNPTMLAQFTNQQAAGETYFGGAYIEAPYLHANGYLSGYSCTFYSNWESRQTVMLFASNLSYHELRAVNSQLVHAYFNDHRTEQKQINAQ